MPEVCFEILSSNRIYDRTTKRLVYAAAGVREYWTIEQDGTVERWHGAGLDDRELREGDIRSPLLADFVLPFDLLFPGRHR